MNRRYAPSRTLLLHVAVILLAACAAAGSATSPVQLAPAPAALAAQEIQLQSPATFRLGIQYGRELPAGSRWRPMGLLAQGTVYRPLNLVFMVEGQRVGEAYPVVKNDRLQGFFLPNEGGFSPIKPVALSLRKVGDGRTELALLSR
ncbi:MAG: hypothetical protein JWQ07_1041 [Ramlibacter sp.]|nr:hypothetical protein [Ramlibacter sp.]